MKMYRVLITAILLLMLVGCPKGENPELKFVKPEVLVSKDDVKQNVEYRLPPAKNFKPTDALGLIATTSGLKFTIVPMGGGGCEWGKITGTLGNQADLMTALGLLATKAYVDTELTKKSDLDVVVKNVEAGSNITITPSGNKIKIAASGGSAPIDVGKKGRVALYAEDDKNHLTGLLDRFWLKVDSQVDYDRELHIPQINGTSGSSQVVVTEPYSRQYLKGDYTFNNDLSLERGLKLSGLSSNINFGNTFMMLYSLSTLLVRKDGTDLFKLDDKGNLTITGEFKGKFQDLPAPLTIGDLVLAGGTARKKADLTVKGENSRGYIFLPTELNGKLIYSYGGSMGLNIEPNPSGSSTKAALGTFCQNSVMDYGDTFIGDGDGKTWIFSKELNWRGSTPKSPLLGITEKGTKAIEIATGDSYVTWNALASGGGKLDLAFGRGKVYIRSGMNSLYNPALTYEKDEGGFYWLSYEDKTIKVPKTATAAVTYEGETDNGYQFSVPSKEDGTPKLITVSKNAQQGKIYDEVSSADSEIEYVRTENGKAILRCGKSTFAVSTELKPTVWDLIQNTAIILVFILSCIQICILFKYNPKGK